MKIKTLALLGACLVVPSFAYAQEQGAAPETPAVTTPDETNPDAPVAGENSFTEEQAKTRIEEAGYTNVINLKLGEDGIWQATARKGDEQTDVQLDYQGNVTKKM
ncbi:PepSY domain-containing protein [Brucellaceae bacterium D45D]